MIEVHDDDRSPTRPESIAAGERLDCAWQDDDLARTFVESVRVAIPFGEAQLDVMMRVIEAGPGEIGAFVDLGCGDGILAQRILDGHPEAEACLVDFSEPMLVKARNRFADAGQNVHFVNADLADSAWFTAVEDLSPFDTIVSGYAIHHQPDERKMAIYREIFHLLGPGGVFVNIEHVSSPTDDLRVTSDALFVDSLAEYHESAGTGLTREQVAERFFNRKDKHANVLAPVDDQCDWLSDIGFEEVDCYFKVFELAVFGGRRPPCS